MLVPLVVFAFEQVTGWWPEPRFGHYEQFYDWVSSAWLSMEAATIAAAVVALRLTGLPFLMAPLGSMVSCSATRWSSPWPWW